MVNYSNAIRKPFLNIGYLVIGILLSTLPIIRWFAKGYILENSGLSTNRVPINKSPKWTNFSDLFVKGLLSSVIAVVYFIPAILVLLLGAIAIFTSLVVNFISTNTLDTIIKGQASPSLIQQFIQQNWVTILPSLIAILPILLLALILGILAFYLIPVATLSYINTNDFGQSFNLTRVFKKAFRSKYFVAWLMATIVTLVLSVILHFIPLVGNATAYFISGVIAYSIYGQVYKEI
ncbi:MAG: DUF4013 domain-containing protein [Candidatus Woesearchaeota archaeon]